MDDQNKNLILATVLSFLVIFAWFILFPPPEPTDVPATVTQEQSAAVDGNLATTPPAPGADTATAPTPMPTTEQTRDAALSKSARLPIETGRLQGSISLKGGRIDDLRLSDYRETIDPDSDLVTLLSPAGSATPYYTLHGWAPAGGLGYEDVPGPSTEWTVESGEQLTEATPITLRWDNGNGLTFRRTIEIDENYMFHITQSVENATDAPVRLAPYGIVARQGEPDVIGFYILHEGVVRASDGTIDEIKYKKMPDMDMDASERAAIDRIEVTENGWIGFTDKYWMTTLVPEPGQPFSSVAKYTAANQTYQTDMRLPPVEVAPGATHDTVTMLFAGAKEWETIRNYQDNLGIEKFIDSIDWGWFFFLTKPIFQILHWFNALIGNMGWAIIGLTFVIKLVLFPLAYKSYVSMSKMKKLQPEMEKIKESAGDDRMKMQQEMMALYKKEKVNPASGCLPILLQIPIFFSLYKVIFVTIEVRHAPFIGWIKDLSAPDPTSILNLFGLLPWDAPGPGSLFAIFSIGVLPILMGITMWMQQKLNPAPTDKTQAMVFAWMPWIFMFMLGQFAAGLVLYWVVNNTITFIQQFAIMRSQGVKPDIMGNMFGWMKKKKAS
ncbi:membrane protein insertase YidC [Oceanomicrobium pacificus]|uniref:Membrane protein insertase YidC n=1 Tax=Oceanomicrobium pacificus TaxID=2692916 RepID=A0A6B0TR55_9RHOB|nr:membrane protein insertase YidC [Oceanomicrobium pacificus]MXU66426.1 membrane protein insertase YidC [Oceanomicrobium pacificus]